MWADRATQRQVGQIHYLGVRSLKATCRLHTGCICMITVPVGPGKHNEVEKDVLRWLDAANTEGGISVEQHLASARVLKQDKYKMRVRR